MHGALCARGRKVKAKVLVVDDEKPIAEILKYNLKRKVLRCWLLTTGKKLYDWLFRSSRILFYWISCFPVWMGSVCAGKYAKTRYTDYYADGAETEIDKCILGLELGADDYVTKPFSIRELLARIKATLRRVKMQEKDPERLTCGELTLDLGKMELKKGDRQIELTYREFTLLSFLLKNTGYVFSREKLLEEVWGYDYIGDERTVDVTVRRLREKIEDDPGSPLYLYPVPATI